MGGGSPSGSTSQTSTAVLPQNQQSNIDLLMQGAQDLYKSGGPQYYPGQTVAPTDPNTTAGRALQAGYASGAGSTLATNAQANDNYWLNPQNIFNPSNIPGFNAAQSGVTSQVTNNLMRNILPQVTAGSVSTGSLGGSRNDITKGLAIGDTNNNLATTLANMNMNAYSQGLTANQAAAARAPGDYALGLEPGVTQENVGLANQSDAQKAIDALVKQWNFNQMAPTMNLQNLKSLTGTAGQYGGTTTSNGQSSQSSDSSGAILGTVLMAIAYLMA